MLPDIENIAEQYGYSVDPRKITYPANVKIIYEVRSIRLYYSAFVRIMRILFDHRDIYINVSKSQKFVSIAIQAKKWNNLSRIPHNINHRINYDCRNMVYRNVTVVMQFYGIKMMGVKDMEAHINNARVNSNTHSYYLKYN